MYYLDRDDTVSDTFENRTTKTVLNMVILPVPVLVPVVVYSSGTTGGTAILLMEKS